LVRDSSVTISLTRPQVLAVDLADLVDNVFLSSTEQAKNLAERQNLVLACEITSRTLVLSCRYLSEAGSSGAVGLRRDRTSWENSMTQ